MRLQQQTKMFLSRTGNIHTIPVAVHYANANGSIMYLSSTRQNDSDLEVSVIITTPEQQKPFKLQMQLQNIKDSQKLNPEFQRMKRRLFRKKLFGDILEFLFGTQIRATVTLLIWTIALIKLGEYIIKTFK